MVGGRPLNSALGPKMQVGVHANMSDESTQAVADSIQPVLRDLTYRLHGEYGGIIENLWIDLELLEHRFRADGKPQFPFRFQKRVSGRSHFGLPPMPDSLNVGHYSVRPDIALLRSMSASDAVPYVLKLIYDSTETLRGKRDRIGDFDVDAFRESYAQACAELGYAIVA